jgi:paraquat-inducible protein A
VPDELIACHDCDMLHRTASGEPGAIARCQRCGTVLYRNRPNSLERTLAFTLAGIALFVCANTLPFLSFDMRGNTTETTLATGIFELYDQGYVGLSGLVMLTAVLAPGLQLALLVYVLLPLRLGRRPWALAPAFRAIRRLQPWSMLEVFLIGILVALVKLADMAEIIPGLALWSFGILILVLAGATSALDPREVWKHVEVST